MTESSGLSNTSACRTAIAWLRMDEPVDIPIPPKFTPAENRLRWLCEFRAMVSDASRGYGRPRGYAHMGFRLAKWAPDFVDAEKWDALYSIVLNNVKETKYGDNRADQQIYEWIMLNLSDFLQVIPQARRKCAFLEGFRMAVVSHVISTEWHKANPDGYTD